MRALIRALPLALAALLLLLAAACGGSGKTVSDQPADPAEVFAASAQSFQDDVQSVEAAMQFSIDVGGFAVDVDGDMAFQAPDSMHISTSVTGMGSFEMLMLGPDVYLNIPQQGWVVFSAEDLLGGDELDELGVDANSFQELFRDHSFVDYAALIAGVGGDVEDLGEETVDGATYRHYRGTLDFAALSSTFSDAFSVGEDLDLEGASGPLVFDAWVDPETYLPHTLTASGEIPFGAAAMAFDSTMTFSSYNQPVEIPDAPADAVPFAELLAGLFQQ